MEIKNAVIANAITVKNPYYLAIKLTLEYEDGSHKLVTFMFSVGERYNNQEAKYNYQNYICSITEAAGVNKFAAITGKTVRVKVNDDARVEAIGSIHNDKWFYC